MKLFNKINRVYLILPTRSRLCPRNHEGIRIFIYIILLYYRLKCDFARLNLFLYYSQRIIIKNNNKKHPMFILKSLRICIIG